MLTAAMQTMAEQATKADALVDEALAARSQSPQPGP
jgi:hypothetical protein